MNRGADRLATGFPEGFFCAIFHNRRYAPNEKSRSGIAALPDGAYRFEDMYDNPELGRALPVSVEITIAGDKMRLCRVHHAEADCRLRVDGSHLFAPPWGLADGEAGGHGAFNFSDEVTPAGAGRAVLHPGDTVEIVTPGAGGYGPPMSRDPASVARDTAASRVRPGGDGSVLPVEVSGGDR